MAPIEASQLGQESATPPAFLSQRARSLCSCWEPETAFLNPVDDAGKRPWCGGSGTGSASGCSMAPSRPAALEPCPELQVEHPGGLLDAHALDNHRPADLLANFQRNEDIRESYEFSLVRPKKVGLSRPNCECFDGRSRYREAGVVQLGVSGGSVQANLAGRESGPSPPGLGVNQRRCPRCGLRLQPRHPALDRQVRAPGSGRQDGTRIAKGWVGGSC